MLLLLHAICSAPYAIPASADELVLQDLITEALQNNHDVLMSETKAQTAKLRILQAESLPDPMLMVGYLNDGVKDLYTFDQEMAKDSQWMFSYSQMIPFPGKLSLSSQMASRDAAGRNALTGSVRLKTVAKVKELYYDLFFTYKSLDLIKDRTTLFAGIEDAALARYSAGMADQQEVIMAQTEKYMLLEKETMLSQKIQALEAMINTVAGRDVNSPLGRPQELPPSVFPYEMNDLIRMIHDNSPEIKAQNRMIEAAETKIRMAEKEYYPDFTVTANYFAKNKYYQDMWGLTTTINIPIFYRTKQRQAVLEAESVFSEADHELKAMELMLAAAVRDNYSMLTSSEKLMALYKDALVPKTYQEFESGLSGYTSGKVEAMTVIGRLKSLIEYETLYWQQFTEREKAIARLEAITAVNTNVVISQ